MIKSKLTKRLLAALTSLCLAATAAVPAVMSVSAEDAAPTASIILRSDVGSAKPGDTINVDVVLDSDTGVGGVEVTVEYDTDLVTYVSGAEAEMSGLMFANDSDPADGDIGFVGFNANAANAAADEAVMATLQFTLNEGVTAGNVRFSVSDDSFVAAYVDEVATRLTTNGRDSLVAATDDTALPFVDMQDSSVYYYQSARFVYENGLMTGMNATEFRPSSTLSRAQFATMIYRLAGSPSVEGMANPFRDNQNTSAFYYDAVIWCNNAGIITGYLNEDGSPRNMFGPSDLITREQLALMMYRYADSVNSDSLACTASLDGFGDAARVSAFAQEALQWAVANGIVSGRETNPPTIVPQANASRGDCATMMARYMNVL